MFFAAFIGSIIGPIISRFLQTHFANASRLEAEKTDRCQYMVRRLEALMEACKAFWGSDAKTIASERLVLAASIQSLLHEINIEQIALFKDENSKLELTREEWRALHRTATGGDFDEENRAADGRRLTAILHLGAQLRQGVITRRGQLKRHWFSG